MSLAHTCDRCGLSLSHLCAAVDPIYRLPIVVCPECRTAAVRRSDGHRVLSREKSRMFAAVRSTLVSLIALAAAVGAALGSAAAMVSSTGEVGLTPLRLAAMLVYLQPRDATYANWADSGSPVALIFWLILSVWAGAYMTVALPHHRRWLVVVLFVSIVAAIPFAFEGLVQLVDHFDAMTSRSYASRPLHLHFVEQRKILYAQSLTAVGALAGIPLGLRIRRSLAALRRIRRRKLRARTRKRRQGQ